MVILGMLIILASGFCFEYKRNKIGLILLLIGCAVVFNALIKY